MTKAEQLWLAVTKRADALAKYARRLLMSEAKRPHGLASANAPSAGGVYVVFNGRRLLYVGETADLKRRLRNLKRTRTHTLRRSVGRRHFRAEAGADGKFPAEIEAKLDKFLLEKCRYSFLPIRFGRKEVESFIIRRDKPTYNDKPAE